jgi:uncharacterized protein involved in exopolysaccharide biosynthesis
MRRQVIVGPEREISLGALVGCVWRGRWLVLAMTLLPLVPLWAWMATLTPKYSVEVTIAPLIDNAGQSGSSLSRLANGFAGFGALSLPFTTARNPVFGEFMTMLTSTEVAQIMVRDAAVLPAFFLGEWDAKAHAWRAHAGPIARVAGLLRRWLHFPPPQPPDAERLATYLRRHLVISTDSKTEITTLTLTQADPAFAERFLVKLCATADDILRQRSRVRLEKQVAYISHALQTVSNTDQRQALTSILSDTEKFAIMANSNLPFAAEILDGPSYSSVPSFPQPLIYSIAVVIAGLTLGCIVAAYYYAPARRFSRRHTARAARAELDELGDDLTDLRA